MSGTDLNLTISRAGARHACDIAFARPAGWDRRGMNPQLRQTLVTLAAAAVAIWLGFKVAEGSYLLPSVAATIAVGAGLTRLFRLPFDVILTGMVIFGYLAGNRGFAQLMPAPGVPLFPAEAVLLVAGSWRCIRWAFARRLPFSHDRLELIVLAWLVAGSVRFGFDLPRHGFLAIRDFATVYYAAFFFLVLDMARDARARRWLLGSLIAGLLALPVTFGLSELFPRFFQTVLVIHQAPVIFFKGDLAFTFLGVGSLLVFFMGQSAARVWSLALAMGMALWILASNNRASLLGVAGAAGLLLLAGKWRYPFTLGATSALAALALAGMATVGNSSWADAKLQGAADRFHSIVDFSGQGSYMSGDSYYKGHNNRFRAIWWKNVVMETWSSNPLLGLGFGHDMADAFIREYYPEAADDEFLARSPHNIFITIFGRMGLIGSGVWLGFCGILIIRTWRSLREPEIGLPQALWCSLWVLLISATFGVVLEGPMGAVVFWSILGLAQASTLDLQSDQNTGDKIEE